MLLVYDLVSTELVMQEKVPKLEPIRIPMNQEKAPEEENFDQIGR